MQGKYEDLTGQRFGMLVVIGRGEDYVSSKGHRRPRWLCQCDCGGTTLCQGGTLKSGRAQSCGCLQKKLASERMKNKPPEYLDITGQRFGRLVAVKIVGRKPKTGGMLWECQCDCGNTTVVETKMLRSGNTQSCGCLRDEKISKVNQTHGESHTRLYNVWNGMRQRCNDPGHKSYANYGGRGIKVCEEWNDYTVFKEWALENGYDIDAKYGECTLDRIDVNGNYEPSNCRWVSEKVQAQNKRNSKSDRPMHKWYAYTFFNLINKCSDKCVNSVRVRRRSLSI